MSDESRTYLGQLQVSLLLILDLCRSVEITFWCVSMHMHVPTLDKKNVNTYLVHSIDCLKYMLIMWQI